jgi:acetyl esterase/lipase
MAAQQIKAGGLTFNPDFAAAAATAAAELGITRQTFGEGDVESRRQQSAKLFGILKNRIPDAPVVTQTKHKIPSLDGTTIELVEFRKDSEKEGPGPAVYHVHGGGLIMGDVDTFGKFTALKAAQSGIPFFSIEYRIAPEHQHPVPVNDCYAGLQWLSQHASELGIDPSKIVVQGESAGGGLAAGMVLMARDKGLNPPVLAQQLIYPMLDDRNMTPNPAVEPYASWKVVDNITGWKALLGEGVAGSTKDSAVEGHEYAAPARAKDLTGLPPTFIDVGQLDIVAPECLEYTKKLVEAGVATEFHLYAGLPHAFEGMGSSTKIVQDALANRRRWLESLVGR